VIGGDDLMNKRMTIGLFTDVFFPMIDGVVNVVDNYGKYLSKEADVYVFAPDYGEIKNLDKLPYKVIRTKSIKIPKLDYRLTIPEIDITFREDVSEIELDIVHIHSPFAIGMYGINYAKAHKIPVVATLHSQYKKDFYERIKNAYITNIATKELMRRFNKCDRLLAVNEEVAKVFYEYGAHIMPMVTNNATDLLPFMNNGYVSELKERYHINTKEKVLLYVGRLDAIKNLDFLIDSLILLKNYDFNFKMIFIGSGPFEGYMKKKINKNGLQDFTVFTGRIMDRTELSAHYKLANLFLLPSLYDSSSLVQIEAASQNTPTLFIEKAVTASTVKDGINGYISRNSSQKYAEKIVDIFKNENEYKNISRNAYRELYITWEQIVDKLKEIYSNVIETHNSK
jgi:glycosyltransferase involved in cell wall biosynthesis